MKLFSTRQPRQFRRVSIYTNESRDRLQKIINDVKREQGELVDEPYNPDKFRGTFSNYTPRAQRFREGGGAKLGWPVALLVIIALAVVWHYLLG